MSTNVTANVIAVVAQNSEPIRVRILLQPPVESHALTGDASMSYPASINVVDGQHAEIVESTARTEWALTAIVAENILT